MFERFPRLIPERTERQTVPFFGPLFAYIRTLSPGDRFIALSLIGLVLISLAAGLYGLERIFLVAEPSYGGTLTEGVVGSPRFINPLLAISDTDRDLVALTYAGLMGEGPDGALVPVLAQGYTVSPDGKTYTFTLRQNARFSDGTPVTADDVVFTVSKAQDSSLKSPELANWANIRAEAIDARTVRFTLPKAYAPFLEDTTLGILPAHLWRGISDAEFPFSTLVENPVGAGPFKVANVTHDKNGTITGYTVRAFSGYALGRPYLDAIHLQFFESSSDVASALSHGAIESAYGVSVPTAETNRTLLTAPYSRVFGAFFNPNQDDAFKDMDVRKALSLAIDRDHIVNDILGGFATPVDGPVPPGSGIAETPEPTPSDHLAQAAGVLEQAGWKYDTTSRSWKKGKLELSSITLSTANVPELKTIASAIQTDWQKLGIAVSVQLSEPSDLTQNVIRPRKYDVLLFGMVVGHDHDLFAFWDSSERTDPGLNIALYNNPKVDSLLEKIRAESDPVAASSDLAKVDALITADYPAAFTHAPDFLYVVPKDLKGVMLSQIGSPSDRFANVANWYRSTEYVWPFFARTK